MKRIAVVEFMIWKWLQFHLLPIRDWNTTFSNSCFYQFTLQFHLLPIRDWNVFSQSITPIQSLLQFHLLPIRDWNGNSANLGRSKLYCNFTYSLLGIETNRFDSTQSICYNCNFTYSLLGIETKASYTGNFDKVLLQFHLLPIRDWNCLMSSWKLVTSIAISLTPY